ncbi:MAG: NAD-dependent epimerase/dehydratase family protein, partial [Bacteroidota bacterium]
LDSINEYYSVNLKHNRLKELGLDITDYCTSGELITSELYPNLTFVKINLEDGESLEKLFANQKFDIVCNLAAQAGVRYSLENPSAYVDSNLVGFVNILEGCRNHGVKHLVYASSSSVYGTNSKIPFETTDSVDHPISLYAATKKSNELMAHTYSHLFKFACTGLRFFTVYGPWGRPDMAMFLFTEAILNDKLIKVFNHGKMERDFTYIDDITEGVVRIINSDTANRNKSKERYKVYNIGNNKSEKLLDFIETIEEKLGKKAKKDFLPMQPGDVERTWANVDALIKDYGYSPNTSIKEGVSRFVDWYVKYHK